jgi:5-methylcytosine-specific restriction endonuclease McrA
MKRLDKKRKERIEKDKAWSTAIRKRDKGLCQWCLYEGKRKAGNQPHHIIPRSRSKALRHDLRNGVLLCFYCHHRKMFDYAVEYARFIEHFLQKTHGISYEELKKQGGSLNEYPSLREKTNN